MTIVNPLFFHYRNELDVPRLLSFAKPSAVIVTGHSNRNHPAFQQARLQGAEVYLYLIPVSRTDERISTLDEEFFMGNRLSVPLWPFATRVIYPNTKLLDLRVGSVWANFSIEYIAKIIQSKQFDGIFIDAFGPRYWGKSDWENWSANEKKAWSDGVVDWIRRLDLKRKAIDPTFKLIPNNFWTLRPDAHKYMDGICIEGHSVAGYSQIEAQREYGTLGQRRVLTINSDEALAKAWAKVDGVTNVCWTHGEGYALPQTSVVGYTDIRIPPDYPAEIAKLQAKIVSITKELDVATEGWKLALDEAIDQKAKQVALQAAVTSLLGEKNLLQDKINQIKGLVNG